MRDLVLRWDSFTYLRALNFLIEKNSAKYLLLILFLLRWSSHVLSKINLVFKDIVFWDVTACSLVDRYRRFGWGFCVLRQGRVYAENGDGMFLRNFGNDHQTSRRHIAGYSSRHNHRCENRVSYNLTLFFCCGVNSVALCSHVGVRGAVLTRRDSFHV